MQETVFNQPEQFGSDPVQQPPTVLQLKKRARSLYNQAGLVFVLYFVLGYGFSYLFGLAVGALAEVFGYNITYSQALSNIYSVVIQIVVNVGCVCLFKHFNKIKIKSILRMDRLSPKVVAKGSLISLGVNLLAGIVVSILIAIFSVFLPQLNPSTADFSMTGQFWADFWMLVMVIGVAPITEEYLFRGVLQTGFSRYGNRFAIVLQAVLFALLHGNVIQAVPTFFIGLVLGYVVSTTGSLYNAIFIHVLNNLVATVMSLSIWPNAALLGVEIVVIAAAIVVALCNSKKFAQHMPKNHPAIYAQLRWPSVFTAPVMAVVLVVLVVINIISLI